MNRYILSLIIAAAMFGLTGCNKFLTPEPTDKYSETVAFSSEKNAKLYVNSFYPIISHYGLFGGAYLNGNMYVDGLTDIIKTAGSTIGSNGAIFISVSTELLPKLGTDSFALRMFDDSMMPEFRPNDVLVIDLSISPQPGNYVLVKIAGKAEVIVCQYKKLSYTAPEFELLTLNDNWPNIKVSDGANVEIIGSVVEIIRGC